VWNRGEGMMGAEGGGSGKLNIDMINSTSQGTTAFWNNKKVIAQSSVYDFLLSSQHSLSSLLVFFLHLALKRGQRLQLCIFPKEKKSYIFGRSISSAFNFLFEFYLAFKVLLVHIKCVWNRGKGMVGTEGGGSGNLNSDVINSTSQGTTPFWNNKKVIAQSSVYDFLCSFKPFVVFPFVFFFPCCAKAGLKDVALHFPTRKKVLHFRTFHIVCFEFPV